LPCCSSSPRASPSVFPGARGGAAQPGRELRTSNSRRPALCF